MILVTMLLATWTGSFCQLLGQRQSSSKSPMKVNSWQDSWCVCVCSRLPPEIRGRCPPQVVAISSNCHESGQWSVGYAHRLLCLDRVRSCVEGELNFSLAGFLTQGTASLCEAARAPWLPWLPWRMAQSSGRRSEAKTIFQCLVLSGPRRLDPLSTAPRMSCICRM